MYLRRWPTLLACALVLSAAGCGSGDGSPRGPRVCSTESPAPDEDLALLPDDIPLDDWGTVVQVAKRRGYVGARAITESTIVELYPQLSKHIRLQGFQTISGENEGFEAEIFFTKGPNTGSFLLRQGPCKGQVTIKLLFGATPAVTPTPMASPTAS